jgi:hypothetical protein
VDDVSTRPPESEAILGDTAPGEEILAAAAPTS